MPARAASKVALMIAFATSSSASVLYTVSDIGTLGGRIDGYAINNRGEVTGSAGTSPMNSFHAFLYADGYIRDLGSLGAIDYRNEFSSVGMAINDSGQVAGTSRTADGSYHAYLYTGGAMVDLGTLGGRQSAAYGINNAGEVTGNSESPSRVPYAFVYSDGQMMQIGPLGHSDTSGSDINNIGQIVGGADNTISRLEAFLYMDGQTVWLGSLGGGNTEALALNDHGQVTGSSSPPAAYPHAYFYADGTMTDIAPQWYYSVGTAISNQGEVVGYYAAGSVSRPFVYSGGVSADLLDMIDPALGITSGEARGVNDVGQILLNANAHTYILTPVPEPAGTFLLVFGLFAWGLAKGRAVV